MIDFRSDTVTRPTKGMLDAMFSAPVGDDVFGEDPTVNALEEKVAKMFGREASLFCPSGTMSNQVAIKCHTQPGDEVICEQSAHVYIYEGGGIAFNSGSQVRALPGERGQINALQIADAINPDDVHKARTSLVCLENTCNRGGGSCYDMNAIADIRKVCEAQQLSLHLDGARLFNALVAKNEFAKQYGNLFHSISICLNKGLGCPIGSVLIGDASFIKKARRVRKVFGGGLRQVGYMAAAGIYALDNHIERLATDHSHAKLIAEALSHKTFISSILPVETNIVIANIADGYSAKKVADQFASHDIHIIPISPMQLRFVTHLDISSAQIEQAIASIEKM